MSFKALRWPIWRDDKKTEAAKDLAMREDFQFVFGTPQGARVLAVILHKGMVFSSTRSLDRATRDMVDGGRELAMEIYELAGFRRDALSRALIENDLRLAQEENRHGPDDTSTGDSAGINTGGERSGDDPATVITYGDS